MRIDVRHVEGSDRKGGVRSEKWVGKKRKQRVFL